MMIVTSSMSNNKDPLRDSNMRCTPTLGKESRISQSTDCSDQEQRFLQHFDLSPKPLDEAGQHHHTIPCTEHATRNNEIMGFMGIHQNTCHMAKDMVYLPYGKNERSDNDGRRTSSTSQRSGMEPVQEDSERERIFLCPKVDEGREIYSSRYKTRSDHTRSSTSQNKIKPARCWQRTNKTLVAFRSLLMAWTPERNDPRQRIPSFIIHDLANIRKVLCSNGYAEEKVYP